MHDLQINIRESVGARVLAHLHLEERGRILSSECARLEENVDDRVNRSVFGMSTTNEASDNMVWVTRIPVELCIVT